MCYEVRPFGPVCYWVNKTNSAQSCPTLCDTMDCSLAGSSVHEILQARILELPFPPPEDLSYLGIKPQSPVAPGRQILYN